MNYNTDGFNERTNYIHNSNDMTRLRQTGPSNIDSSFAKMKINENKPNVETVNLEKKTLIDETRGNKENFIIRNKNMFRASNQMKNNFFKKN